MIYELRVYHILPGKMEAINNRFANHTLKLFAENGVNVSDFWVDATGAERLYYICEFEDEEAMAAAWKKHQSDPRWIEARAASEVDGKLIERVESYIMKQAPYFG